ncbi:MAG TPA: sugar ABC transporter permease [Thermoanaerobaculia bacterium]|nr:sugar ABC transporter permease [Thermoanaerobaculia bacterium]
MTSEPRPASHRRRFLIGLALAALVGVGLGAVLLAGARTAERRERAERQAVVTLQALAQVVDRAVAAGQPAAEEESGFGLGEEIGEAAPPEEEGGGMGLGDELAALDQPPTDGQAEEEEGAKIRQAVASFARSHPEAGPIRVVLFEGTRLEASTAPSDQGANAAPRRLAREEKPLFDLGQSLRAAVSGNQEGGGARSAEISLERRPDGVLSLAAPLERDGEVVGMVQMETKKAHEAAGIEWGPFLFHGLAPVVVLFLLSLALGERRWLLAAAAVLLLLASLLPYGNHALKVLREERRATGEALAATIQEESDKTGAVLAELGLPAGELAGSGWDVDLYRQPRGLVSAAGTIDEGKLGEETGVDASRMTRSVILLAVLALVLLAFVGLGYAARTGQAFVEYRIAYAYVLPALIGMLLLVFFPFFYGIALSFTNANLYNTNESIFQTWIGLQNYIDIIKDVSVAERTPEGLVWNYANFYWTLGFTILWTISNVTIGVTLGLALALILNTKDFAFKTFYRVILILPWATPTYITALVWKGMFHQQFGAVNQILQIFGASPISWFDRPFTSFLAVLTTNGWLSFPFMMVISLGALQSIPADLYEAARVDGASRWQQFRSITLPSLKPALVPAIILSVVWTFNQFNVIYLVSAGQPAGATEILITKAYKLAFEDYRYGYAAAYSTIIFLILLVYGTWQNRVTKATEAIG